MRNDLHHDYIIYANFNYKKNVFPINNDKNYSDYKYGMGDLHQRLTELRRCLDDGLINQNGYDSARD
jgi:hypothetical protein